MTNLRWRAVLYGAAGFLTAHLVERVQWTSWFADRSMVPWFTNSGRAVLVTMLFMFLAEVGSGNRARDRRELMIGAANVAAGGIVAMIATMIAIGPGTIAPLVIIIGGALVIAGAFAGTPIVAALSRGKR